MTLPELVFLMDEFGMDPITTQILYIPNTGNAPDSFTGFPKDIPVVPTVIKNMVTGEMAIAILPKSELPKMELVNPEEETIHALQSKAKVS